MMDIMDQVLAAQQGESGEMNHATVSPEEQLTYDPTQVQGTSAWELSRKASMELNAQLRRN